MIKGAFNVNIYNIKKNIICRYIFHKTKLKLLQLTMMDVKTNCNILLLQLSQGNHLFVHARKHSLLFEYRKWNLLKCATTIAHRISETNSSCHGKSLISIFQEFSSSIKKTFILARGLGTRLSFYAV